jgi:hypothetical protein
MHSTYNFISNLHSYDENASNTLFISLQLRVQQWPTPSHTPKLTLLRIYSSNLDQFQTCLTSLFSLNSLHKQEQSCLLYSLKNHVYSTTLAYSLPLTSFRLLLRIQIDTRAYKDYIYLGKVFGNGQTYFWRSYMCFLVLLYIWESTKSLESRCIGIQTLIKDYYTRFQTIYL